LEEALQGLPAGTKRVIMVAAEKAYGARDEKQIRRVPRSKLPVDQLNVGDMFQTDGDRHAAVVTVVAIEGEEVLLDANHPLAGQDLIFDVEVLNVRAARQDEIDHGHIHGPDAHGHGHGHGHDHGHGHGHEHGHGHGDCGCGHKH
jgi:FKBP-type peptidyl-prolyl cis-trans isomerase SlyD